VGRLIVVELLVRDLERSARFYRDVLGVPLEAREPHPPENQPHYEAEWGKWGQDGFLYLGLYPAGEAPTSGARVGFQVEDVDAIHTRAKRDAVPVVDPPADRPWGRTAAYEDPDRNVVSTTQPPKAERA
jgi:catechol 2,3-dioxygenase-like lactoylglutathione lyase family enzyme